MLKWFNCDAGVVEVAGCLQHCPLGRRCLTKPTLMEISTERPWNGKPSTTQLLNGTMYSWLKITRDYAIIPQSRAFALLGTRHHQRLNDVAKQLGVQSEIELDGAVTGVSDLLEIENGEVVLTDMKTYGSYKLCRIVGRVSVPAPRGGKTAQPKTWYDDPDQADTMDLELQLNHYRVLIEEQLGIHIDRMQAQVTVRDGGLRAAKAMGVHELMCLVSVKRLGDTSVRSYFERKGAELLYAMEHGWMEECTEHENWSRNKCRGYCEVSEHCRNIAGGMW